MDTKDQEKQAACHTGEEAEQRTAPQEASQAPAAESAQEGPKQDKKKDRKAEKKRKSSEEERLRTELEAAQKEAALQKDRLLRTAAEYDNYRKRSEREKDALYASATAEAAQAFLPVADNLERALQQQNCSVEDLRKGVEMVQKQLQAALDQLGLEPMGKPGEAFDAQLHNAVSHVDDDSLGENVIAEVYQKGYKLGDKVVRHAMVKVAN